jgi:hypothetical protein
MSSLGDIESSLKPDSPKNFFFEKWGVGSLEMRRIGFETGLEVLTRIPKNSLNQNLGGFFLNKKEN